MAFCKRWTLNLCFGLDWTQVHCQHKKGTVLDWCFGRQLLGFKRPKSKVENYCNLCVF